MERLTGLVESSTDVGQRKPRICSDIDDVGRVNEFYLEDVLNSDRLGHTEIDETLHLPLETVLPLLRTHRSDPLHDLGESRLVGLDAIHDRFRATASDEPSGDGLDKVVDTGEELAQNLRIQGPGEHFDVVPTGGRPNNASCSAIRPNDLRRSGTGLDLKPGYERDTLRIQHLVGDDRRHQLPAKSVHRNQGLESVHDLPGEVTGEKTFEEHRIGQVRVNEFIGEISFRVGEQYGKLRSSHSTPGACAFRHRLSVWQYFDLPIESCLRFEENHEILVGLHALRGCRRLLGEDLRLEEVVIDDGGDHIVRDRLDQLVSLISSEDA